MKRFPTKIEDFSSALLEQFLHAPQGSIEHIAVTAVGTGQMAASFRIQINWQNKHLDANSPDQVPTSVVAKCASANEASLAVGTEQRAYYREVRWYQDIASGLSARLPKCYFADIAETFDQFILVLEDCAPAVQGDQLGGTTVANVEKALLEAANFHATFINQPELLRHKFLQTDHAFKAMKVGQFEAFWPKFKARYSERLGQDVFDMGDAFAKRFRQYLYRETALTTVAHNDFRLDNMLFGGPDGRVILLDWQTLGLGGPMNDVSYFCGTSFESAAERKKNDRGLFDYYANALADRGVYFDDSALWHDYRVQAFSSFVMAVYASMLVEQTERGDEMFAIMADRPASMAMDLDSLSLL